jgi:hypothetical protein
MKILNAKKTMSLAEIFQSHESEELKKVRELTFQEDLLTLSVCAQRLANAGNIFMDLTSEYVATRVTDLDRARADQIRKYYQQKLLHLTLQGSNLSKYRKDLQDFLYNTTNKYKEGLIGLAYKLPYFYDYDQELNSVFDSGYVSTKTSELSSTGIKKLKFVKSILNLQRSHKSVEYWFKDDLGDRYMISFSKDDLLLPLLDRHISSGCLDIRGMFYKKKKDNREFFNSHKFSFL